MSAHSWFWFTTSRPVAVAMMVVAACVFGLVGLLRLPVNLLPDISHPTVTVRTTYPGASPRDVEERISERVQELVAVVPGARRVHSVSRPGVSDVVLEFGWNTPMARAVNDVRERLDRYFPPPGAERPLVLRYDPSLDPVLTLGLRALDERLSLAELRHYADLELEEQLASVEGVAAVRLRGGDEEEIRVAIDEQALTAAGIDIDVVARRLAAENMNAASGAIEEGRTEFLVRALNEFRSPREIEQTVLVTRGTTTIRLGQVARIERVPADPVVICRIGGAPCVLVDVYKEAGANIVDICAGIRTRVFGTAAQRRAVAAGEHLAPMPPGTDQDAGLRSRELSRRAAMTDWFAHAMQQQGIGCELLTDQSRFIENAIDEVRANAVQGGLLAIVVIFLFLRSLAATAILAVSIPISLLITFAPMFLSGVDLNVMSLGGLALGVGMLVDNSIVVLESIQRRREAGDDTATAAVQGTARVATAVLASTLTTVAVFFPIVFVEGLAGQLFGDLALTVVYSLLMSLLAALFVVPMLASRRAPAGGRARLFPGGWRWIIADAPGGGRGLWWLVDWGMYIGTLPFRAIGFAAGWAMFFGATAAMALGGFALRALQLVMRPVAAVFQAIYGACDRAYPLVLAVCLRRTGSTLLLALALVGLAVWQGGALGQTILPQVQQGDFTVQLFASRAATVRATDAVARALEVKVAALPEVASTFVASGVDPEELNDSAEGKHSARIVVRLRPAEDRAAQETAVRALIAGWIAAEPQILDHRFASNNVLQFDASVVVELVGHDLLALRQASELVAPAMAQVPALRDVSSTLQRGNPELTVRLDRDKLAALGLDAQAIAQLLRQKVLGDVPTLFSERERKIDIRVRVDRDQLAHEDDLRGLNVNPQGYPEIPLGSVADIDRREGPSEIRRLGNVRGAEVRGEVAGFDLAGVQRLVQAALADVRLPRGIEARLGGQKEEMERSSRSLTMALLLAVFLVYIVMASQFESLLQPLIIMVTVPLAIVGVVFALRWSGTDLSVIVFLGAIVLAGIVVNNAILLIDQTNRLRAEGVPLPEAVLQGAHSRLRPVAMTTTTTLLGLLPQTGWLHGVPGFGGSQDGIELRAPMAITVIAGLTTSTLLTLIVVPLIYRLVARWRA